MIKKFARKNDLQSREVNGSREAQMVWTICVGFAVILAALFQVSAPRKSAISPRIISTDYGVMGGVEGDGVPPTRAQSVRQTASTR